MLYASLYGTLPVTLEGGPYSRMRKQDFKGLSNLPKTAQLPGAGVLMEGQSAELQSPDSRITQVESENGRGWASCGPENSTEGPDWGMGLC